MLDAHHPISSQIESFSILDGVRVSSMMAVDFFHPLGQYTVRNGASHRPACFHPAVTVVQHQSIIPRLPSHLHMSRCDQDVCGLSFNMDFVRFHACAGLSRVDCV